MGRLTNLRYLGLSGNQLEGCIPWGLDTAEENDLAELGLPFCNAPGPPINVTLSIEDPDSLTTTWAPPASGPAVSAYDLRFVLTENDERIEANWTIVHNVWADEGDHWYVITGLSAGEQYDVQVRAVNADGQGPWSITASGTPAGHVEDDDTLGNRVADVMVEASPDIPNAAAQWTVQFLNGDIGKDLQDETANKDQNDNILEGGPGRDVIMIEFEDDVQFPQFLSSNDVVIAANMVWDGQAAERTVVANPLGVGMVKVAEHAGTTQKTDRPPDETLVTLDVPDMEPAADRPGTQGIAPGATVTVTFRQASGIKNPTESKADEVYGEARAAAVDANGNFDASLLKPLSGYKVQTATSNNGYFVPAAVHNRAPIPRRLLLSDMAGPRWSTVTVMGLGFRNSITATIWHDRNRNGLRDSGEIDLGSALITGTDDFTTTITISNPPFMPDVTTSGINAIDGRNRTIIPGRRYIKPISGIISTETIPDYLLESYIILPTAMAAIGDTIQVIARDFVPGANTQNARITIGNVAVTTVYGDTVSDYGDATLEIPIPEQVTPGIHDLIIRDGPDALNEPGHNIVNASDGGGARASITITGVVPRTLASPIIRIPPVPGDRSLTLTWRAPTQTASRSSAPMTSATSPAMPTRPWRPNGPYSRVYGSSVSARWNMFSKA